MTGHGEKFIFLDIDGVLNARNSNSRIYGSKIFGVDDDKIELLSEIVKYSGALIVLISSWKSDWVSEKDLKIAQGRGAKYLDEMLAAHGLEIRHKTPFDSFDRGKGIKRYLSFYRDVAGWVVLDDEICADYDNLIIKHLVKTSFETGLTKENVDQGIEILNSGVGENESYYYKCND